MKRKKKQLYENNNFMKYSCKVRFASVCKECKIHVLFWFNS